MSSKSTSLGAYEDAQKLWELALHYPGMLYELPDHGRATYIKQRCNRYRSLLIKQDADIRGTKQGQSRFDQIILRQVDEDGTPSRTGRFLRFDSTALEGTLTAADGTVIDPESFAVDTTPEELIPPDFDQALTGILNDD